MYSLVIHADFSAAHSLRGYQGACERLHGHNWKVEAGLCSDQLNDLGMVMDFRDVKKSLNAILDRLDHGFLNDVPPFNEINPTTENIARTIFEALAADMPAGVRVNSIRVWESDTCGASYQED